MNFRKLIVRISCVVLLVCSPCLVAQQVVVAQPPDTTATKPATYLSITAKDTLSIKHLLAKLDSLPYLSPAQRAMYGVWQFSYLDKSYQTLQPDSLIDYSIAYFKANKSPYLASALFYKARMLDYAGASDKAMLFYLKAERSALANANGRKDYDLLARIYNDIGLIYLFQNYLEEARVKLLLSQGYFQKTNDVSNQLYTVLDIASTYTDEGNIADALRHIKQVLPYTKTDSTLRGVALSRIASIYWDTEEFDSVLLYLQAALRMPPIEYITASNNYRIAAVFYKKQQYDSATLYAQQALLHPISPTTLKGCYGILTNIAQKEGNTTNEIAYLRKRDSCNNIILNLKNQQPARAIEEVQIHKREIHTLYKLLFLVGVSLLLIIIGIYMVSKQKLHKQNRNFRTLGKQMEQLQHNMHERNSAIAALQQTLLASNQETDAQLQALQQEKQHISEQQTQLEQQRDELIKITISKLNKQLVATEQEYLNKGMSLDKALCKAYHHHLHIAHQKQLYAHIDFHFNHVGKKLQAGNVSLSERESQLIVLLLLHTPHKKIGVLIAQAHTSIGKFQARLVHKFQLESVDELRKYLHKMILQSSTE